MTALLVRIVVSLDTVLSVVIENVLLSMPPPELITGELPAVGFVTVAKTLTNCCLPYTSTKPTALPEV